MNQKYFEGKTHLKYTAFKTISLRIRHEQIKRKMNNSIQFMHLIQCSFLTTGQLIVSSCSISISAATRYGWYNYVESYINTFIALRTEFTMNRRLRITACLPFNYPLIFRYDLTRRSRVATSCVNHFVMDFERLFNVHVKPRLWCAFPPCSLLASVPYRNSKTLTISIHRTYRPIDYFNRKVIILRTSGGARVTFSNSCCVNKNTKTVERSTHCISGFQSSSQWSR